MTAGSPPQWWTDGVACPQCGEGHERRCAGHRTGDKQRCRRWPLQGHWTCVKHGAGAPQVRAKTAERQSLERARAAALRLGLGQGEISIDPAEAMLAQVRKAAYNVAWYEQAIAELQARVGRITFGKGVTEVPDSADEFLAELVAEADARHTGAVEADSVVLYLPGKESDKIAPHTLVELYNAERDRLVKYSAECRRAGVEERRIEITAELGRQLVEILRAVTGVAVSGIVAMAVDHPELVSRINGWASIELPALAAAEVARVRAGGSGPGEGTAA